MKATLRASRALVVMGTLLLRGAAGEAREKEEERRGVTGRTKGPEWSPVNRTLGGHGFPPALMDGGAFQ